MTGIIEEREIIPGSVVIGWSSKPGWGKLVTAWSPDGDELRVDAKLNVWGLSTDQYPEWSDILTPFGMSATGCRRWFAAAKYNRAGERIWTYDGAFPDGLLAEWDGRAAAIAVRLLRASGLPQDLYLRWGRLPKCGQSRNYATGELESGISAYTAEWNPATERVEFAEDGTLGGTAFGYVLSGRSDCYLLTGTEIGRGSDGEPLLVDARVIGKLRYDRAQRGFAVRRQRQVGHAV